MRKIKQWSKWITLVLLLTQIITWVINVAFVIQGKAEVYMLNECTNNMFISVMPYFALTAVERVTNLDSIKEFVTSKLGA